jgi:prolipoprotein diacylglyceryltransferase
MPPIIPPKDRGSLPSDPVGPSMVSPALHPDQSAPDRPAVGQPTPQATASRTVGVGYTRPTVLIATITFGFDPILRLGPDIAVRWQTVGLAGVIALVLLWSGAIARRLDLRADDLLSIVIAAVPGAVIAGRLAWIAAHPGVVGSDLAMWLDPGIGGFDLAAAVLGGITTGAGVAALLGAPVGRWAHLLTVPLLLALAGGKATMILGGSGQGLPTDVPWSTAFVGDGPWGSLAASVPSHPSQAYEGLVSLALALIVMVLAGMGGSGRADGRLLMGAVGAWALLRAVVSVTWRDPVVAGPLSIDGWLAVVVGLTSLAVAVALALAARRRRSAATAAGDELEWPDPAARPQF